MSFLKVKAFPYQIEGVRKMRIFKGRALLADEMGLGKTLQALLYFDGRKRPHTIVICPASLKWHWQRDAWKHLGIQSHVLEGRKPPRGWRPTHALIIVNFDILGPWMKVLSKHKAELIIIDECHKLQNPQTKQTKNTKALCAKVKRIIALSGTPLLSRPNELYPTLNILRPDEFPSFHAFAKRYCRPELKPWGWEYKGAENLKELHRRLRRCVMIRRLKSEVMKELPAKARHVVPLEIRNRKEYNKAVKDFIGWLSKQHGTKAKKAAKAEKLVKMGYLKRLVAELKMPSVLEWIDAFLEDTNEKLIIFGVHKAILHAIRERYKKISVIVDGSVLGQHRQFAIDQFNQDKRCRLFIGNIKAAGVGWSCVSSSVTAFVELGWTPGEHTQAEDRTHGLKRGQEGQVSRSYYLVGHSTIEDDLCRILQEKQRILGTTLDGEGVGESLSIFDQLLHILTKPKLIRSKA